MAKRPRVPVPPLPAIRIAPTVYRQYRETIGAQPPETFALLGGSLDDPFLVTDYCFCPAQRSPDGGYDQSGTHINIDHHFMNWVVDRQWAPAGKYMLGIWHSHPPGLTGPSAGDATKNTGDLVFFASCLANDDSPERNWRYFLAPITTFDDDGADQVHGWLLKRGSKHAQSCSVVVDPFQTSPLDGLLDAPGPLTLHASISPLVLTASRDD